MSSKNESSGKGMYLYENNTNSDLLLPRLTLENQKLIRPKQRFKGDSFFLELVRNKMLKLVKVIDNGEDKIMNENKLILDQPDIVKPAGKVEHVQAKNPSISLNDNVDNSQQNQEKVLLTEDPVGSIQIVID